MRKRVVLGTAGHIDHGKTALVKALTGVDTDRLKEEKQRGITIELGFAALDLPSGLRVGIVDVPGHERFIDHMVAGATGIDLVLLVVAADEGVMPQTVEHLEICRLLGVRTGLVALTKIDLVDEEMQALALEDVQELVRGTFLGGKPIVPFSSVTGEGKEALLQAMDHVAHEAGERHAEGVARLPIDRVFTMRGFGTVVTGTLLSGSLAVGNTVQILPSGLRGKIRGIQVHNRPVQEVAAGSRAAVNLQGIEKNAVQRGECLCEPDRHRPSYRIHAFFQYLEQNPKPMPDRFRAMIHWGTARVFGRIRLMDPPNAVDPGGSGWIHILLEAPIVPVMGDRFIVRDFSTNRTLGGGIILDPHASRYKTKHRAVLLPWLQRLREERPRDKILYLVWKQGLPGCTSKDLAASSGCTLNEVRDICQGLAREGTLVEYAPDEEAYVHGEGLTALSEEILEQVRTFHRANPYQAGLPKEALRGKLRRIVPERLVAFVLGRMEQAGKIILKKDRLRLADHRIELAPEDQAMRHKIEEALDAAGVMPQTMKELASQIGCEPARLRILLEYLVEQKALVKVSDDLYYPVRILEEIRGRLVRHLLDHEEIQASEFKSLSGTTRKYTIPLLEYFDRIRLTLRVGDRRILRDKKNLEG